jgi:hypothetical protein
MDHAYLSAQGIMPTMQDRKLPGTKDWVVGSDMFLRLGRETIINTLLDHDQHNTMVTAQELQNMIEIGIPEGFERRIQIANPGEGITEMHVLNVVIKKLQSLAGRLARQDRDRTNRDVASADKTLKQLYDTLQTGQHTEEDRQGINIRISELKMHLKDKLAYRAAQEDSRIDTFQNSERGRMTKCSFIGTKDRKTHRNIDRLLVDGQEITDQDQIVEIMRDRYMQCTGQEQDIGADAVKNFVDDMGITMPTLTQEQQDIIGDEITRDEVRQALQTAKAHSAPGPTGQTIGFYKFIFQQIPYLFTRCMNVITFWDDILDSAALTWIKQRKVIYIPKPGKDPLSPSSYRPLSLLEVLYKIPAKIMTDRIGTILPTISYADQCGFVPGRGAQYSTLTAGHVIQDAENTGRSLQMLGMDIGSAFDTISGECIRQCMILNRVPMHVVTAIHNLTKLGRAQVEVNGKKGREFVQRSGVGQGDPLSAFRFNIGTEPLLRALRKHTARVTYKDVAGTSIYPAAYADDHLHTLSVQNPEDIAAILEVYNRYTRVSGLCINPAKTELLTINTPPALVHSIEESTGIAPVAKLTLLGVMLADTYSVSRQATYDFIDSKALLQQMRISTRATHMLHRRLIVQATLAPMYTHAFMAFGSTPAVNKAIGELIKKGMWTQAVGGEAKQIRTQVAFKRIFAGYDMGGLNISNPQQVNEGLMLNTLERLLLKDREMEGMQAQAPNIVRILKGLLEYTNCTDIHKVHRYGSTQTWRHLAARINAHNSYLGGCMFAMARFCRKMEDRPATWFTAPLWGHTCNNPIIPITEQDADILRRAGLHTVGQIYDPGNGITIHSHMPVRACPVGVPENTWNKVTQITVALTRQQILRNGTHIADNTLQIVRRTGTFSYLNRKLFKETLAKEITAPPSYYTRMQDGLPLPAVNTYCSAYEKLMTCHSTTTAATAFNFAALNRTVWTARKQAQSGNAGGGGQREPVGQGECDLCGEVEDTAHVLADCNGYSYRIWERFNIHLTAACRVHRPDNGPIHITFSNIMYFTKIIGLPTVHEKEILALLIELKRDIYVRRTERCLTREQEDGHVDRNRGIRRYTDQRLDMHISIACSRILRLLQFRGKNAGILETLRDRCLAA